MERLHNSLNVLKVPFKPNQQ